MRYYFTKESCQDGINLIKSIFKRDGKIFIKENLIDSSSPISIEDASGKRYRVSLVGELIHIERIK